MKKKIIAIAVSLIMGTAGLFAFGIGVQGGADVGGTQTGFSGSLGTVAVTFKTDKVPFVFAVNGVFGSNLFKVGVTADYWLLNKNIAGPLNWFLGIGGYGRVFFTDKWGGLGLGARLPIGLNMFVVDNIIEPYIMVSPSVGLAIADPVHMEWFFPINIGIRFWIN